MCGHIGIHPHLRAPADTRHAISASRVPGYYGQVLTCLFCSTSPDNAWLTSEYGIAVPAAQPLTAGHVVVAPRRHVAGFYDLDVEEQRGLWNLVSEVRRHVMSALYVESVAFEVRQHVAPILDAHRNAHQPVADARLVEFLRGHAGVRGGFRMAHQRLDPAQRNGTAAGA